MVFLSNASSPYSMSCEMDHPPYGGESAFSARSLQARHRTSSSRPHCAHYTSGASRVACVDVISSTGSFSACITGMEQCTGNTCLVRWCYIGLSDSLRFVALF